VHGEHRKEAHKTVFDTILVANRGEIALRIMATCREMGIATVGIYSDVDRDALHVLAADEAVHIGPSEPAESYLNMEKIIRAAKQVHAQAIHPGYGFLAENPRFARLCEDEGIVFIGPPSRVIRDLGDKTLARRIMSQSGIPVIPGMLDHSSDPGVLAEQADSLGYPVIIKAAGGGGGKGMRVVKDPGAFRQACEASAREAMNAFGNADLYLERYVERPRHVEFQILADSFGNVVHLYERECSIQRRHQKIIEETPSTAITEETRHAMGQAAIDAARASGYVNAGTVEFLLADDGTFYFLEVNTRLQVEHPVTEAVTGIDIVRLQIEIASGKELALAQGDIVPRGHAIECRIYAEDPLQSFMPCPGTVVFVKEPRGPGIRVDSCLYSGCVVPMEYDPILAKLVVHAHSRDACIERAVRALQDFVVMGVLTPIPLLRDILASRPFRQGRAATDFVDGFLKTWSPDVSAMDLVALAYAVDRHARKRQGIKSLARAAADEYSPWSALGAFRP